MNSHASTLKRRNRAPEGTLPHNTLPFQENCKQGFDKVQNL